MAAASRDGSRSSEVDAALDAEAYRRFRLAWPGPCATGRGVIVHLTALTLWSVAFLLMTSCSKFSRNTGAAAAATPLGPGHQITQGPGGRILSHTGVWSPDSQWIVYDTRSDSEGAVFDGKTIQMANVFTGEVKALYRADNGAHCGVVTFHPHAWKVAFILGPEHPTPDWQYCPWHRQEIGRAHV